MKEVRKFEVDMSDNVVIAAENIVRMGEVLALCAVKFRIARIGSKGLRGTYQGLIHDIYRDKNLPEPFSDGYDVAKTAMLFLCENMGKRLGDTIINRFGKKVTVKRECYHILDNYLFHEHVEPANLTVNLNDEVAIKLTIGPENEVTEEDYAAVDDKIEQMHLTKVETEVVNCYMSGLGHCEIATILGINRTTIRRRRERAHAKYLECFTD